MKRLKITEELLWAYVEGSLPEKQCGRLESALEQDEQARQRLKEIRLLSSALQDMETEAPSMRFAANVMEAWDQELETLSASLKAPLQTHTDKRIVWGIAAVLLVCLALLFGMLLAAVPAGTFRYEQQIVHAVSGFFLNKQLAWYFLGLTTILLLVLAERFLHYRQFVKHL